MCNSASSFVECAVQNRYYNNSYVRCLGVPVTSHETSFMPVRYGLIDSVNNVNSYKEKK